MIRHGVPTVTLGTSQNEPHAIDEWIADDHFPATKPNGDSTTWRRIPPTTLHRGDEIRIEGTPDGGETAALDYVEVVPNEN